MGILIVLGSYLLGAIPFGFLIAHFVYRIDIRQHGSGNPGATNVWRTLGKKPGITTLFLDAMKGVIAVVVARKVLPGQEGVAVLAGLASIIGHNWSLFLMGKGGKGVATSAGVFLALIPKQAVISLLVFALIFYFSQRVSVGSIGAALALMFSVFLFTTDLPVQIIVVVASIMLIVKHIPNIKRLLDGTEPKVKFR